MTKFILAGIQPHQLSDQKAFSLFHESQLLITSYGGQVVDFVIQKREVHDKGLFLGRGKIEEICQLIQTHDIDVVVLNAIIKPSHIYEIRQLMAKVKPTIEVWDRVDLILQIFAKNAKTAEARLQIEIAAMKHMGPRIYGMGLEMSRQGGGIGGRGIGETNTERMRRHWRSHIKQAEEKLAKLTSNRQQQLQRRQRAGLPTVSIIGYTNAGKSSLFNALTKKEAFAQDKLFATLDSAVGKMYLPDIDRAILLSDTIGFIQDLPIQLVEAFKSTLLESIHADILIHLIDIADPDYQQKISAVELILEQLSLSDKPKIYVFNKIDQPHTASKNHLAQEYALFAPQFISAQTSLGLAELRRQIADTLLFLPDHHQSS